MNKPAEIGYLSLQKHLKIVFTSRLKENPKGGEQGARLSP
jgi:hypothetical protein